MLNGRVRDHRVQVRKTMAGSSRATRRIPSKAAMMQMAPAHREASATVRGHLDATKPMQIQGPR